MESQKIEELDLGRMKPDDIEKLYEELNVFGITFDDSAEEQSSDGSDTTNSSSKSLDDRSSTNQNCCIKLDDSIEQDLSLLRTHSMEQVPTVRPKKIKTD